MHKTKIVNKNAAAPFTKLSMLSNVDWTRPRSFKFSCPVERSVWKSYSPRMLEIIRFREIDHYAVLTL